MKMLVLLAGAVLVVSCRGALAAARPPRITEAGLAGQWLDCTDPCGVDCPGAKDLDGGSAVFHSAEEIASLDWYGTANAGSYGVMFQFSLPSYEAVHSDSSDVEPWKRGHPDWSCAFPSLPGVAWRDPANSVYAADAYFAKGPVTYPSRSYKGYGASAIWPPSGPGST